MKMMPIGLLSLLLCAAQVFSIPISNVESEDDTKVMKCIVEVISDTLSKPKPVPITQDCLETLRGDERIISILRHQNLLKELQELASQGAMERLQKTKKSRGYEEELSGVLEKQNKAASSETSDESSLHMKPSESEEDKRQPDEETEKKGSSERTQEEDSAEELENNEISKREEVPEDEEEIDNHITDEINHMALPKDNPEDTSDGASEERESVYKKFHQDKETGDHDKEDLKQESNETDNEEDETQREDNSMRIPEDITKEDTRSENSKENKEDDEMIDCNEEETASKDLEDAKRWNKMDELAKELRAKRCAKRDTSEEDPDQSMKILPENQKDEPGNEEQEDDRQLQSSRESEPQMSKRPDERKEEEGSANRKTEEQELDSLAAIEAELENVAHKLHDLRRG